MTGILYLEVDALDTLMFRDGRPFNQQDEGASRAVSVFPPYPPTLVGAVRAALWRGLLDAGMRWDKSLLGDGTDWQAEDTLGPLNFGAPTLLRYGRPLFPAPLHLVKGKEADGVENLTYLLPGKKTFACDLGDEVALPVPVNSSLRGIKTFEGGWIAAENYGAILNGDIPDRAAMIESKHLWSIEPRVGIGIDPDRRVTSDSRFYMASHIRLAAGVSLGLRLSGWQNAAPEGLRPVAGEHRMAYLSQAADAWPWPQAPRIEGTNYCVILISPMVPLRPLRPHGGIVGLPGRLVSACLGKSVPVGGWDSANRRPIPLRRAIPAGSVLFMETEKDEWLHVPRPEGLGIGSKWGFGQFLIGKW